MEITINKADFEAALPVGTASHDEVFESVEPAIKQMMVVADSDMLGDAGTKILETSDLAVSFYKQFVCLAGFLQVLRQLDLTLTPTGFGIVSNDTVSPASKQRVDALEGALRIQLTRTHAMLINMLRSEEWGTSTQAEQQLPYLYDEYTYIFRDSKNAITFSLDDWHKFQETIASADEVLRMRISDEQMDELLDAFRRNDTERMKKYNTLINLIYRYTDALSSGEEKAQISFRKVINTVEKSPAVYDKYHSSDAYKLNHHETFQNTKESSAFLFNG